MSVKTYMIFDVQALSRRRKQELMIKKNKAVIGHAIFAIIFVVSMIYIMIAHSKYVGNEFVFDDLSIVEWNSGWDVNYDGTIEHDVTLPAEIPAQRGNSVILRKSLPDKIKKYNCIMLEGKRQDISVSIGGIQRASYSNKSYRPWGNTSPSGVVLVPLYNTDSLEDVAIHITSDSTFSGKIGSIYLGNEKSLVVMVLKSNIVWLFLTVMVLILGIVSLVSYYIYGSNFKISNALHYLSVFSIMSAVWSFSQSGLRQIFFDDITALEAVGYCCYMVTPVLVVLYANRVMGAKYTKQVWILSIVDVINFTVENVLVWTLKFGFFEMRHATQLIFILSILLTGYMIVRESKNGFNGKLINLSVGIVGLLLGVLTPSFFNNVRFLGESANRYIGGAFIFAVTGFVYTAISIGREQKLKQDRENAYKAKSVFLAAMSHEIKTPLNAMLGMNEMIMRDTSEDVIREYSAQVSESGMSLLGLVNDILDFSMIEAGKMDIVNVKYDMKSLIGDLASVTESRLNGRDVKLILDIDENIPSECVGDKIRIKQVMTNLLSNAVKYTSQGEIRLSAKKLGMSSGEVELKFSVSDTGEGILPEDVERLKESFVRVEQVKNSSIAGTGLGLSITTQLLELMGSKLEIASTYGEGSEFSFIIKQEVTESTPIGGIRVEAKKRKGARKLTFTAPDVRVLAVDDNKMNLTVLKGILKSTKMQIELCNSGKECLELCRDNYYDIIFMDHMMPDMDGIETFKRIRGDRELKSTDSVVFVLTANTVSGAAQMYKECGFDYYLKKPIDVGELNDAIIRHISIDRIRPLEPEAF